MADQFYSQSSDNVGFAKQSILTGKEKAAILFSELGGNVTEGMLQYFSNAELKQIRKYLKKLGKYNLSNEIKTLEETNKFGMARRILSVSPSVLNADSYAKLHENDSSKRLLKNLAKNADSVANVISVWLKEDN